MGEQFRKPKPWTESKLVRFIAASAALHALGAGVLVEKSLNPDPTAEYSGLEKERQFEVIAEHNREITEQLRQGIEKYVHDSISRSLDPAAKEYKGNNPEFVQVEAPVYFHLDAMMQAYDYAASEQTQLLDKTALQALIQNYEQELQNIFNQKVNELIGLQIEWTGDYHHDFPQLQRLLFISSNRFFSNANQLITYYSKDNARVDLQLLTGMINCQVARWTPLLLEQVYRAKHMNDAISNLKENYKIVLWKEHMTTGVQDSSSQNDSGIKTLNLLDLRRPIDNLQPQEAINPGRPFQLTHFFSAYVYDAYGEQKITQLMPKEIERLVRLGMLRHEDSPRYLPVGVEAPNEPVPIDEYIDEILEASSGVHEVQPPLSRESREDIQQSVTNDAMYFPINTDDKLIVIPDFYSGPEFMEILKKMAETKTVPPVTLLVNLKLGLKMDQASQDIYHQLLQLFLKDSKQQDIFFNDIILNQQPRSNELWEDVVAYIMKDEPSQQLWLEYLEPVKVEDAENTQCFPGDLGRYKQYSLYIIQHFPDSPFAKTLKEQISKIEQEYPDNILIYTPAELHRLPEGKLVQLLEAYKKNAKFYIRGYVRGFDIASRLAVIFSRTQLPDIENAVINTMIKKDPNIVGLGELWSIIETHYTKYPESNIILQRLINRLVEDVEFDNFNKLVTHYPILAGKIMQAKEIQEKLAQATPFEIAYYQLQKYAPENRLPEQLTIAVIEKSFIKIDFDRAQQYNEFENSAMDYRLTQLYRRTFNPEQRMQLLNMLISLERHQPFIKKADLYPMDLAMIQSQPWQNILSRFYSEYQAKENPALFLRIMYDADSLQVKDLQHVPSGNVSAFMDKVFSVHPKTALRLSQQLGKK